MGISRITYIIALVCAMLFFVLYPHWFGWYLFVVILLLLPFDFFISLPGMLTRKLMLGSPRVLEQGTRASLVITTICTKYSFPARCLKLWVQTTVDDGSSYRRHICSAAHNSRYEIDIDTSRSGITSYSLKRIWTVSLLGFFSMPGPARFKASILVLPQPVKPPQTIALPRGIIFRPKQGGGFAEDHDLRAYRQGDPIRSIHWKVSAKMDSLIIREPLVPPPHSRLVSITQWNSPKQRSIILGRLRWISNYLLKWELPFYVKLGENGTVAEVTKQEDLINYLYCELCDNTAARTPPVHESIRFTWVFKVTAADAANAANAANTAKAANTPAAVHNSAGNTAASAAVSAVSAHTRAAQAANEGKAAQSKGVGS